jgi:hypothetical protein
MKADFSLRSEPVRMPSPRGGRNHPESVYSGLAYTGTGKPTVTFTPLEFNQDRFYNLLTFVSDAPIIWDLLAMFHDLSIPNPPTQVHFQIPIVVNGNPTGNPIFTPAAGYSPGVDPYEELHGTTITNGVDVHGYLGALYVPDYGMLMDLGPGPVPATAPGRIRCWAQAPVMYGPLFGTGPGVSYDGIFLEESLYTEDMATAGNLITVDVGGGSYQYYRVVGLVAEIPIP